MRNTNTDMDADADLEHQLARLPGESAINYAYFLEYLQMGIRRGIATLAKQLGRDTRHLERLSSRFHWVARARIFDDSMQRAQLAEIARQATQGEAA